MKLNPDCVRDVILTIEQELVLDENGYLQNISPDILVPLLSKYEKNEIFYVVREMFNDELLEKKPAYINEHIARIADITPKGHKFIKSIKSDKTWKKIKINLLAAGIFTVSKIVETAINELPNLLK